MHIPSIFVSCFPHHYLKMRCLASAAAACAHELPGPQIGVMELRTVANKARALEELPLAVDARNAALPGIDGSHRLMERCASSLQANVCAVRVEVSASSTLKRVWGVPAGERMMDPRPL